MKQCPQVLGCYQQSRKGALQREESGRYLTLRPPETLLSAHADAVIRGAEKGEKHYCAPLATLHGCKHLPLKNAFHSLTAAEGDKAGIWYLSSKVAVISWHKSEKGGEQIVIRGEIFWSLNLDLFFLAYPRWGSSKSKFLVLILSYCVFRYLVTLLSKPSPLRPNRRACLSSWKDTG